MSMGVGEYVSVSTQRDTEHAALDREREELATDPDGELEELVHMYEEKGLSSGLARQVAVELSGGDRVLEVHAEMELGITPGQTVSPWAAAIVSTVSFSIGSLLPLAAILIPPAAWRSWITFVAVLVALALTGSVSARLGGANRGKAVVRVLVGGALAMAITYGIGRLIGGHV